MKRIVIFSAVVWALIACASKTKAPTLPVVDSTKVDAGQPKKFPGFPVGM